MYPAGILRVYACRPARPASEKEAVKRAVQAYHGSISSQAQRLAAAVAVEALREIDENDADAIISLLRAIGRSPVNQLATDPVIDTGALIRADRADAAAARGGRRLPEADWPAEDRRTLRNVTAKLAQRYARILREK